MRIEYDPIRDLLGIWFRPEKMRATRTETVAPGVHIDFDDDDKLIGADTRFEVAFSSLVPLAKAS